MAADSTPLPSLNSGPIPALSETGTISSLTAVAERLDETAGRKLMRQASVFMGIGYLTFALLLIPTIRSSFAVMDAWWNVVAIPLVFGTGIAMAAFGFRGSVRTIRIVAAIAVMGYLISIALWWFGWNGVQIDLSSGIWLGQLPGLIGVVAAIGLNRPILIFGLLCVMIVATDGINQVVRTPAMNIPMLPDVVWSVAYCLVYFAAAVMALRTIEIFDKERSDAFATIRETAAASARADERRRFDQLTHDAVMATLLAAARQGRTPYLALRARSALDDIDWLARGNAAEHHPIPVGIAVAQIRAAVTMLLPRLKFATDVHPDDASSQFPVGVIRTITAAAAEAVRNSKRHAGPDATVVVSAHAVAGNLRVEIADNGAGFDVSALPGDRMGVLGSIRGRMDQLAGAEAEIISVIGRGTVVRLSWTAPS